ncbi:MAG: glycine zipper 2TM domain-containing protein [Magnetospirillum sp.]|nr:glycine zipper 2TM domain-containing protein [Magnetospirillum sp.]
MKIATAFAVTLVLAACASNPTEGEIWGTSAGAVIGGGIGRAAATGTHFASTFTPVGAVAGAAAGYMIGGYFDPQPQRLWAAATVEAAETGKDVRWESRGLRGDVAVLGAGWTDGGGRPCRRLGQTATHADRPDTAYAREVVACALSDGTWEVVVPPEEPES